ncbi:MAG: hypothetical protein O3C13_09030 [Bacteroidetes bacterium]|nr:hypothetical protein [Bacteroidota bacterium]
MKKLLLLLVVMATMFACTAPEKKADASTSDPDTGTFSSQNEKSQKVREALEAYMKNDSTKIYEIYVDTVKVYDQISANQEGGKTKPNPGGRAGFAANERMNHDFFSDIKVTTDNIKTFVFADGRVSTGVWCIWTGKGKFTNKDISAPLHLVCIWEGDKIVSIYRFFDPTVLYAEVAASQKQ